jgi:hypothetical protein
MSKMPFQVRRSVEWRDGVGGMKGKRNASRDGAQVIL